MGNCEAIDSVRKNITLPSSLSQASKSLLVLDGDAGVLVDPDIETVPELLTVSDTLPVVDTVLDTDADPVCASQSPSIQPHVESGSTNTLES